jgi:Flp pilus assembly protein TadD
MSETTFLSRPIASFAFILFISFAPTLAQTTGTEAIAINVREKPSDTATTTRSESLGIDDYQKLLAQDPNDVVSENNLGALYFQAGRYDEALDLIAKAAAAKPDLWNIQINLSIALAQKNDYDKALEYAKNAFKLAGTEIRVRQQLCDMYLAVRDSSNALQCYEALVADSSSDAGDHLGFAEALLQAGDVRRAESILQDVIRMSPRDPQAYNALGMAQYEQKHYKDAVNSFREAVTLDPDQPRYRFNMAVSEMATSNRAGALSQYNLLKGSNPKLADELYQMMFADKLLVVGH